MIKIRLRAHSHLYLAVSDVRATPERCRSFRFPSAPFASGVLACSSEHVRNRTAPLTVFRSCLRKIASSASLTALQASIALLPYQLQHPHVQVGSRRMRAQQQSSDRWHSDASRGRSTASRGRFELCWECMSLRMCVRPGTSFSGHVDCRRQLPSGGSRKSITHMNISVHVYA